MKISKQELLALKACRGGLKRFIKQTSDTDESVDVVSLIGGENTTDDLLWLARKKLNADKIVKFACDCALINIELIKPYTDSYDLIVKFLSNPSVAKTAKAAKAAIDAATSSDASAAAAIDAVATVAYAAIYNTAAYTAIYADVAAGCTAAYADIDTNAHAEINKLLVILFTGE